MSGYAPLFVYRPITLAEARSPSRIGARSHPRLHPPLAQTGATPQIARMGQRTDEHSLTGQLLIAMPAMGDPNFTQSVIYLCAHSAEGAMGIVINRPLRSPSFADLLRQLDLAPVPPVRNIRLIEGGPVEHGRGFVLHSADWTGEGSLKVNARVALTASLDVLKAIAEGGGPKDSVLALGYAGWGPGQLDDEMQQNAWLSVPGVEALVFDEDDDTKWRRALASMKIDPLLLSGTAGRA